MSNLPQELIQLIFGSNLNFNLNEKLKKKLLEIDSLPNLRDVIIPIQGFAERNRIESKEELSDAMLFTLKSLIKLSEEDKEGVLRPSRLPDALQLLILLASAPTSTTLEAAHNIVYDRDHPIPPTQPLTLKQIMGDDWIEDQPRLPYVSDSEPDEEEDPLSSSSSSISAISIDFPITPQKTRSTLSKFPSSSAFSNPPRLIPDFKGLEDVHKRQYWKSTSSNESNEILGLTNSQIVWSEVDTMREILGLLQGRTSAGLFEKSSNEFQISETSPVLSHLSAATFRSILSSFLPSINSLYKLRSFITSINNRTIITSPTIEAFSSALESFLYDYQKWCVDLEIALLSPQKELVISLLKLSDEVETRYRILETLVNAINTFSPSTITSNNNSSKLFPSQKVSLLLNYLSNSIENYYEENLIEMGNCLRIIFEKTFESIWSQIGEWILSGRLRNELAIAALEGGVEVGETSEFFIKRVEDLDIEEVNFLENGFELESSGIEGISGIPEVLKSIAVEILECGKAVHMLRSVTEEEIGRYEWPTFSSLLGSNVEESTEEVDSELSPTETLRRALFLTSIDQSTTSKEVPSFPSLGFKPFSQFIEEKIFNLCQPLFSVTQFKLHRIFSQDCQLNYHLVAIQGIFLMRKSWEMNTFLSIIFEKMDKGIGSNWSDFQSLNSTWNRSIQDSNWIDSTLIRFRVKSTGRGGLRNLSTRSVKVFENLQIDYSVPSTLAYIFSPQTMIIYSQVFIFLHQIRRAKHLVDRMILIKLVTSIVPLLRTPEQYIKRYYSLRRKLNWIISTLLDFFESFVIEKEIKELNSVIKESTNIQELIEGHEIHVFRLRDRMLLNSTTQPLHKAIISILDLGVNLSDTWTTLNSDSTLGENKSRSFSHTAKRRYKLNRCRSNRNHQDLEEEDDDSDYSVIASEGDYNQDETTYGTGGGISASYISLQEQGFSIRIEKMEVELESLVGFVRRGVEGLKSSSTASREVRDLFGILSETLEGWK